MTANQAIEAFDGGQCFAASSLPLSYYFFLKDPQSIESLYATVAAGGDTDTNAALVGSLLGTLHGKDFFPEHLVNRLLNCDMVVHSACDFWNSLLSHFESNQ